MRVPPAHDAPKTVAKDTAPPSQPQTDVISAEAGEARGSSQVILDNCPNPTCTTSFSVDDCIAAAKKVMREASDKPFPVSATVGERLYQRLFECLPSTAASSAFGLLCGLPVSVSEVMPPNGYMVSMSDKSIKCGVVVEDIA